MTITTNQLREQKLLHAESILEDIERLKEGGRLARPDVLRLAREFSQLLELAVEVVTASDDAVFDKLSELEGFLR